MHLYGETLDRYVTRDLPPAQLAAIDGHVSNCLFCAHALAQDAVNSIAWERRGWLGRLVRIEAQPIADAGVEDVEARAA
jgi:hypothetical protein